MMLNSLNICPQVAFLTAAPCYILTIKVSNLELAAPAGCSIHWCRTGEKIWSLQWNIASQASDNIQKMLIIHCVVVLVIGGTDNSCAIDSADWFFINIPHAGWICRFWGQNLSWSKFAKKRGSWDWLLLKKGHGIWPCQSKFEILHCIVWIEDVKVNRPVSHKDACLAALLTDGQKQRPVRHCIRWRFRHGDAGGLWIGLRGVTGY